jgi:hypothetical protein
VVGKACSTSTMEPIPKALVEKRSGYGCGGCHCTVRAARQEAIWVGRISRERGSGLKERKAQNRANGGGEGEVVTKKMRRDGG